VIEVKQLGLSDLEAVAALRRQALESHPHAFGAAPEEDRLISGKDREAVFGTAGQSLVFGAYDSQALVGMAGLARATGAKRRHKAIIWGMYVVPSSRRKGVGRMLLDAIVAEARRWPDVRQLHLSVTEVAAEARRLYDSAGFVEWGREPRSLKWAGRFADEIHLALQLE
jgi:GNAT superfamily N-acetyltransferase